LTGSSLAVPVGYNNLTWGNLDYLNAVAFGAPGYTAGMISASNVVYNGSGSNAVISSSVAFDLLSAYLTAAWRDNLQVELQGYNGAALIYDHIYTLSATSPTLIQFNYLGVTSVEFSSSGGTAHPGYSESGTQFAMDNVGVFFPPSPPVITLQPTSETVPTNQSIIFNVAASGSLPLNFSWSRNGEAIADATDSTYTTTNLQVSDSGSQFMCTVTNAYGSVTSSPAVLTVVRGSPTLITFDDLSGSVLDVPTGYGNLNWYNFGYLNGVTAGLSGYNAAVISVSNVVYNGGGSNAVISSSTPFDLFSAYLTAAWRDNLQVEVQGYNGTSLIYDNTYILSATAPMLIPFNYLGVTSVQFSSSGGTAHSAGYSESGTQFAMDNLSVFFPPSVAPLTLPEQVNVVIDELTSLVVTNTANEANLSALPLSYALLAAPLGAGIDVNGVITWVPSQAQSPSTNAFTTAVTDAAIPPNSASNTFTVIVREVNVAPVLPVIGTLSVDELALLSVTNAAAESNIHSTLGYSLVNPPAGMGIDSSGVITWLPQQTQSPSTNLVTTIVTNSNPYDLVNPHLSASNAFTVIVNEVNVPPVLPVIPDQTVLELTLLSVTSAASEPNIHATLSYLLLGPPVGMAVSPDGIITWMPQPTQSPSTNSILEVATSTDAYDAISPNLSVTNSFVVRVLARQQLAVNMVNGHPQLAWNCSPGTSFQVQYRTDLDTGAWLDLGLPIAAAGSTCQYEDDLSSSATTRYYQVVLLP